MDMKVRLFACLLLRMMLIEFIDRIQARFEISDQDDFREALQHAP
jgi:hypothetical protein